MDYKLTEQDFWTNGDLNAHLDRRNDVAHRGASVFARDADASIETVHALMGYMEQVMARHFPFKNPPETVDET